MDALEITKDLGLSSFAKQYSFVLALYQGTTFSQGNKGMKENWASAPATHTWQREKTRG